MKAILNALGVTLSPIAGLTAEANPIAYYSLRDGFLAERAVLTAETEIGVGATGFVVVTGNRVWVISLSGEFTEYEVEETGGGN